MLFLCRIRLPLDRVEVGIYICFFKYVPFFILQPMSNLQIAESQPAQGHLPIGPFQERHSVKFLIGLDLEINVE